MATTKVYHSNQWIPSGGGVTHLYSEVGTSNSRSLTAGTWTKTQSITLTPGWWIVFGALRINGTNTNTGAFCYCGIGPDENTIRSRNTAPLDIGTGYYTQVQSTTYFKITTNTTLNMYAFASAATTAKGEYFNAIKLADI